MKITQSIFLAFLFIADLTHAQLDPERKALNKLKKYDWNAVRKTLNKSLRKDTANTEARYVFSLLFINPSYPYSHVDSAHLYYRQTQHLFKISDDRAKERLKKFPIDSTILFRLKSKIDSIAFEKAKSINTESAYIHFISEYSSAKALPNAIELRDEVAFISALKENTHITFNEFLQKYPNSHRAPEAQQRFEKLLFEFSTRNKTLSEFQNFVSQNPASPFVDIAIHNIFQMTTLGGNIKSFENFIMRYPKSSSSCRASNLLLHLKLSNGQAIDLNDSLKMIYPLKYWIPYTESGLWGFMNELGHVTFQASLEGIDENYCCSPLEDDFIHASNAIVARNGVTIQKGNYKTVMDLGSGFIKATSDTSIHIIHKSGYVLPIHDLNDALIIGSQFIACKKNEKWGLYSLTGIPLLPFQFDKITNKGKFVLLSKSGKEILIEFKNIVAYSSGNQEPIVADEIKAYGSKYFWIRNGSLEKVLDENLNEVIPFDRHSISYSPVGLIIKKNSQNYLKEWQALESKPLKSMQIFEPWLITRALGQKSELYYIPTQQLVSKSADSVWFDQSFAAVMVNDSIRLWQSPKQSYTIPVQENYTIRKTLDSTVFILITDKYKTSVLYANSFNKLFTSNYKEIEPILNNLFFIKEKGKSGLINEKGKVVLKPEYDAILFSNGIFSLLKAGKFGSYNSITNKLLKPTYESNLRFYNQDWIIGRKKNLLGFIKPDGTNKVNFNFDEIEYWNDTTAIVKQNGVRALFLISDKKKVLDSINYWQLIPDVKQDHLAFYTQHNLYGLLSDQSGIIIKPQFDEITYQTVNNTLIFIGMKTVGEQKAEISYLDHTGKLIRHQVLDKDVAYTILCDD